MYIVSIKEYRKHITFENIVIQKDFVKFFSPKQYCDKSYCFCLMR